MSLSQLTHLGLLMEGPANCLVAVGQVIRKYLQRARLFVRSPKDRGRKPCTESGLHAFRWCLFVIPHDQEKNCFSRQPSRSARRRLVGWLV